MVELVRIHKIYTPLFDAVISSRAAVADTSIVKKLKIRFKRALDVVK